MRTCRLIVCNFTAGALDYRWYGELSRSLNIIEDKMVLSSKRQVYIMKRMQHIRVDAFRQKSFSTPLLEIETIQTHKNKFLCVCIVSISNRGVEKVF